MSVDANFYCLYGVELSGIGFYESDFDEMGEDLFLKDDDKLIANIELLDEMDVEVINNGYDFGDWSVVGIRILDSDPNTMISRIRQAKNKWYKIEEALKEVLDKVPEVSVVFNSYYS